MIVNKYSSHLLNAIFSAALFMVGCKTHFETQSTGFTANKEANVERGKMLVMSSCAGCHYDPSTKALTGMQYMETPKIAGKMFSANLTHSKISPFGKYNDAEFAYLLRTGIARDGHFIPYMLRPNMSDEDISAILAFLRSDDPVVQANDHVAGKTHLNLIGKMGKPFLGKPLPYQAHIASPDKNDAVAYGRYLVDNIGCYHCHSAGRKLDEMHPGKTKGYMAGGRKFKMPNQTVKGANITMDKATGIGNFSKEDFRNAVLHAKDKDGSKLAPPMEAFPMTDKEADAIFAYIQTLPAKKHDVK